LDTGNITRNIIEDIVRYSSAAELPSRARRKVVNDDIIFSTVRPNQCHFGILSNPPANLLVSTGFTVITANKKIVDPYYLYYYLTQDSIVDYLHSIGEQAVSAYPSIKAQDIEDIEIELPDLSTQNNIAKTLRALDNKIQLNRQINDNLELQAQNIFNHYFIDNPIELGSYSEGVLTDIAVYLNGLAMQKFRPEGSDFGLPVLKIKELGQRSCDNNSDRCSSLIKEEYIVNDGDVIFSWSGTLLVDLWCGGKCGLNQHLFKVTSDTYPKWFYYFWTKHHLDNFIRVAKDKAVTMGHIKRTELEKANIIIPTQDKLSEINKIMSPIITKIINHRVEMRKLGQLRDIILPQLMSGELKINEIDC
jgi:type I restriction enzyme S subunit